MLSAGYFGRPLRPSLAVDLRNPGEVLDGRFTWTRATSAMRINSAGVLASVGAGLPRWDYHPTTHALRGVLMEGAATNLFLRSQEMDNASWTKVRSSIAANAETAPDGTVTADKLVEDNTAANTHDLRQVTSKAAAAITYTASLYVKAAERNRCFLWLNGASQSNRGEAWFDIAGKTAGTVRTQGTGFSGATSGVQDVGGGWLRVWLTVTSNSDTSLGLLFGTAVADGNSQTNGDGTSGLYVWGAQLEVGGFPTNYAPTTSAQATRAQDAPTMPVSSFPFDTAAGTLLVSFSVYGVAGTDQIAVQLDDGTTSNCILIYREASSGKVRSLIRAAGVVAANHLGTSVLPVNTITKAALAWSANDFAMSIDGGAVLTDNSGGVPAGLTTLRAGVGIGGPLFGHAQTIACWPRRLSPAELQGVSA